MTNAAIADSAAMSLWPRMATIAGVLLAHTLLIAWIAAAVPRAMPQTAPAPVSVRMLEMPASPPRPLPTASKPAPVPTRHKSTPIAASKAPAAPADRTLPAAPRLPAMQSVPTALSAERQALATLPARPAPSAHLTAAEGTSGHDTPASADADYLRNPAPAYPAASRRAGEQGRVLLRVRVNAQGLAEQVELQQSSGFSRLDDAAQAAVRQWRFVPARRGDEAVAASVIVPITFRLGR